MPWGAKVDVWKGESSASINQLHSCMNNLLTMQKVLMEKLGVQVPPIENLTIAYQSMHKNGEKHLDKPGTTHTIERTCDVMNKVQNDKVVAITTTTCLGDNIGPPSDDPIVVVDTITQQVGYNIYGILQPVKNAP